MAFSFLDWNQQQKALRIALASPEDYAHAIVLALSQHAWTHQGVVSGSAEPTFADQLWDGLDEASARVVLPREQQSIVWNMYHLARIEDIAMNYLIAETAPVFDQGKWMVELKADIKDSGNLISEAEMQAVSQVVDLDALHRYRAAVGMRTQEIIGALSSERLRQKVDPDNIEQIRVAGVIRPEANDVLKYWSKRTIEGLLLIPATRHNMTHINGSMRMKEKLLKRKK